MEILAKPANVVRLDRARIESRLQNYPRLPSLSSIHNVLRELLNAEQCYTSQVSDVIRRDPSMTTRLLRMVNSVYFSLSSRVSSIEEAVFYLGLRQIRQLAMVTPVIEDLQKLAGPNLFPWRDFWQHCLAVAILTREIVSEAQPTDDEIDYVSGLLHDVGKIAMAAIFPDHFREIYQPLVGQDRTLLAAEREVLGIDHCELGAIYLKNHNLPEIVIEAVRYHHQPERAHRHARVVGAVQIADLLVRHARIGNSGNRLEVADEEWLRAPGWDILHPRQDEDECAIARANLRRSLERLPAILEGLI